MRILSKAQVIEKTGYSATSLWRKEKAGDFPRRKQLGPNRIGWVEEEVNDWIVSRPRGSLPMAESLQRVRGLEQDDAA
jgi:prophage regulatory protein